MKTNNVEHYRLIKSVFEAYCLEYELLPYQNSVIFEHGGFSCSAENRDGETMHFRAVDASCQYCNGTDIEHCFNCGRCNEIDFEEV